MKKLENGNYELTKEELQELMVGNGFLDTLYDYGVDNWHDYYLARKEFENRIQDIYTEINDIK